MTTELIKELVGLCVEKTLEGKFHVFFGYHAHVKSIDIQVIDSSTDYQGECDKEFSIEFYLDNYDAPAQLQAAIDKVKAL